MLQYGQFPVQKESILLKSAFSFGHFQFYAGQFDGLNQDRGRGRAVSGLQNANKNFQPNLGSGQTAQIDLDFNRGKKPVIMSVEE